MSRVIGASVGIVLSVGAIITVVAIAAIVLTKVLIKKRAGSLKGDLMSIAVFIY